MRFLLTILLLFASLKTSAGLMETLSEGNSYLWSESCQEINNDQAIRAIGEISTITRSCSNIGGDILRNSERLSQVQAITNLTDINYRQVEDSIFEELVLSHARELECSAQFAASLGNAQYAYPYAEQQDPAQLQLNEMVENALELRRLKKQFSDFLNAQQSQVLMPGIVCPSNLTEFEEMAEHNDYYRQRYNYCSDLIRQRTAIQILENSFPLISLRGEVREAILAITTPGSPRLNRNQIANQLKSSYQAHQQSLSDEKTNLINKLNQPEGIDGFNRGEKRLIFSDVRLNQRLFQTRPELEGAICRMDRRYGTGADTLDMTLGIGSFAVGGMLGMAARGARIAIVARTLGQARSLGLLSVNSARNLRLLAASGVLTADVLTGFSDINNACFNGIELTHQIEATDENNQCVSSPSLVKRQSNNCWLNASLAALGFVGGIGDLRFSSRVTNSSNLRHVSLGLTETEFNEHVRHLTEITPNEMNQYYRDFLTSQLSQEVDLRRAQERFQGLLEVAQRSDDFPVDQRTLAINDIESLFTSMAGASLTNIIANADHTKIDLFLDFAERAGYEQDIALGHLIERIGQSDLPGRSRLQAELARRSSNILILDELIIAPPFHYNEIISRVSLQIKEAIDEDEINELITSLATFLNDADLSQLEKQAMIRDLALIRFSETELDLAFRVSLQENFPEANRFLNELNLLQANFLSGNGNTNLIDEYFAGIRAIDADQELATLRLFEFLRSHPQAGESNYRNLLDLAASNRGNLFYLNGEIASRNARLDGSSGVLTKAIEAFQFNQDFFPGDLSDDLLRELNRIGLSEQEARRIYLNSLLVARIPIRRQDQLISSLRLTDPDEYYNHLHHLISNPETPMALRNRARSQLNKDLMQAFADRRSGILRNGSFTHQIIELDESIQDVDQFIKDILGIAATSPFNMTREQSLLAIMEQLNSTRRLDEGLMMDYASKLRLIMSRVQAELPGHQLIGYTLVRPPLLENFEQSLTLGHIQNRYEAVETFNDLRLALRAQGKTEEEIRTIWSGMVERLRLPENRRFILSMDSRQLSGEVDQLTPARLNLPESMTNSDPYVSIRTNPAGESFVANNNVQEVRAIGEGASGAMLMTFEDGSRGVWKAHNHSGATNYKVDVLVYELDQELGLGLVPETVVMDFAGDIGSIQRFSDSDPSLMRSIRASPEEGFVFTGVEPLRSRVQANLDKQSFFDYLIENNDRHTGNFLIQTDGRIVSIDNSDSLTGKSAGGVHFRSFEQRRPEILRFLATEQGRATIERLKEIKRNRNFRMGIYRNLGEDDAEDFFMRINEIIGLAN